MTTKKRPILASSGRQAAYTARNRAHLIDAAQKVLADIGPDATIEQLVAQAQVSANTVYNHFESKEQLFGEALQQIYFEWLAWAYNGKEPGESLEVALTVCRKLFRLQKTHPVLAKILRNSTDRPLFLLDYLQDNAAEAFKTVVHKGELPQADFKSRFMLWGNCVVAIVRAITKNEISAAEADKALAIALSIWTISETKASKLMSADLDLS